MKTFEYHIIVHVTQNFKPESQMVARLNKLGSEGWEVIFNYIENNTCNILLKREKNYGSKNL